MRRNSGLYLGLIVVLAALAAVFIYPSNLLGNKVRPWRLGLDLVGGTHLVYEIDLSKVGANEKDSVIAGLRDTIERRVNLFGVSEPQVYVAEAGDTTQLVVELAGVKDVKSAIEQIGATPYFDFRTVVQSASTTSFVPTTLNGRYVVNASLDYDQNTSRPQINFTLNDEGAKIFEEITKSLAPTVPGGQGQPLCLFVDGRPIIEDDYQDSCPIVQGAISGGQARITGDFTLDRAKTLVERFNAGALPAPVTLIDQLTVNPSLGADSLRKGVLAGAVGTLLVILFMVGYYRTLGLIASGALLIYIVLTLSVFKLVPITLTLAGLAGFIITIGMAVDANILIFERVREEMKKGLTRSAAIHEGFRRAWPSIRDSNTSTIITAVILYFFTSSFVKGFALTLLIGVLMSLFSAITTTRLVMEVFIKDKRA
jgi:preprotein translocase subunit SecD